MYIYIKIYDGDIYDINPWGYISYIYPYIHMSYVCIHTYIYICIYGQDQG